MSSKKVNINDKVYIPHLQKNGTVRSMKGDRIEFVEVDGGEIVNVLNKVVEVAKILQTAGIFDFFINLIRGIFGRKTA